MVACYLISLIFLTNSILIFWYFKEDTTKPQVGLLSLIVFMMSDLAFVAGWNTFFHLGYITSGEYDIQSFEE